MHHRIAFYSDSYLPAVDGVVTSMLDFKQELERRGHKAYIFATCRLRDRKKYAAKDVFLYPGLKFRPYPQYSVALFPYYSSLKLKKLEIDTIHVQTPFTMGFNGLVAAKVGRYPLVGTFHTLVNSKSLSSYYPKNKRLRNFYSKYIWKYVKFFYRKCDMTIAPSQTIADMLQKNDIMNTAVVPNGINLRVFNERVSGRKLRKKLGIGEDDKVILHVGRLSSEKKVEILLRAAKLLSKKRRDIHLLIAGGGPAAETYKHMARKLGIAAKTTFMGMVPHEELPEVYAAGDLLCLPSTFETQGIVSLEAMAVGKPVVGANFLALAELIENGRNGEKFKPGDYEACARKIEKVLNSTDNYRKYAVSTAKNYSVARVTSRLIRVYDSMASEQAVY